MKESESILNFMTEVESNYEKVKPFLDEMINFLSTLKNKDTSGKSKYKSWAELDKADALIKEQMKIDKSVMRVVETLGKVAVAIAKKALLG